MSRARAPESFVATAITRFKPRTPTDAVRRSLLALLSSVIVAYVIPFVLFPTRSAVHTSAVPRTGGRIVGEYRHLLLSCAQYRVHPEIHPAPLGIYRPRLRTRVYATPGVISFIFLRRTYDVSSVRYSFMFPEAHNSRDVIIITTIIIIDVLRSSTTRCNPVCARPVRRRYARRSVYSYSPRTTTTTAGAAVPTVYCVFGEMVAPIKKRLFSPYIRISPYICIAACVVARLWVLSAAKKSAFDKKQTEYKQNVRAPFAPCRCVLDAPPTSVWGDTGTKVARRRRVFSLRSKCAWGKKMKPAAPWPVLSFDTHGSYAFSACHPGRRCPETIDNDQT